MSDFWWGSLFGASSMLAAILITVGSVLELRDLCDELAEHAALEKRLRAVVAKSEGGDP